MAPPRSAIGALARYVSSAETKNFQPVNITLRCLSLLSRTERLELSVNAIDTRCRSSWR